MTGSKLYPEELIGRHIINAIIGGVVEGAEGRLFAGLEELQSYIELVNTRWVEYNKGNIDPFMSHRHLPPTLFPRDLQIELSGSSLKSAGYLMGLDSYYRRKESPVSVATS